MNYIFILIKVAIIFLRLSFIRFPSIRRLYWRWDPWGWRWTSALLCCCFIIFGFLLMKGFNPFSFLVYFYDFILRCYVLYINLLFLLWNINLVCISDLIFYICHLGCKLSLYCNFLPKLRFHWRNSTPSLIVNCRTLFLTWLLICWRTLAYRTILEICVSPAHYYVALLSLI